MTDEELALFTALDNVGVWLTLEPGPAATRGALLDEFYGLVTAALDALEERLGRIPIGPTDFEELVTELESRDDLLAHPWAVDGARVLLARFEGEAAHLAQQQSQDN